MTSESARMNSAAEARFRVQAPNSMPRAVTVIALDSAGEVVVRRLSGGGWQHATFLTATSTHAELRDLTGGGRAVADAINVADLVVLLAGPGGEAHAAAAIGDACSVRRVMTTAFVVGAAVGSAIEVSKTLAQLRPWSLMLVIADSDEYIDDMMTALRA